MSCTEVKEGCSRARKTATVTVGWNPDTVDLAAEVATTVIMQHYGAGLGATREEVFEANSVALQAVLAKSADEDAKVPAGIKVPVYFDSMLRGMTTVIGRTVIATAYDGREIVIPDGYRDTIMKLRAAGIKFTVPHRATSAESSTLLFDVEKIDDVDMLIGNVQAADLEDLVRRSLLSMEQRDLEVLRSLAGELAEQYGELDEILGGYFAAQTSVALGKD